MKIKGIKVKQGIKIKTVGSSRKERKIIEDTMRRIKCGRKKTIANLSRI